VPVGATPCSKVKDFSNLLHELDAGRPGGQGDVTEREDRLAEVAELLPRPAWNGAPLARYCVAMSHENLEAVREVISAVNDRDLDRYLAHCTESI